MPIPLSRRRFLVGTAAAIAAAALGDGFLIEPCSIDVTRHDVPIPGLPHELDGFGVACITDVHLHRGIHRAARATLEQLARERPHLVALTGDICNRRIDLEDLVAFAGQARGTVATVATLGNWEHDAGIDRATGEKAYGIAGVELLYNSTTRIRVGNASLTVVGIDDPVVGTPDVAAATHGLDEREPGLWVVHAPGAAGLSAGAADLEAADGGSEGLRIGAARSVSPKRASCVIFANRRRASPAEGRSAPHSGHSAPSGAGRSVGTGVSQRAQSMV